MNNLEIEKIDRVKIILNLQCWENFKITNDQDGQVVNEGDPYDYADPNEYQEVQRDNKGVPLRNYVPQDGRQIGGQGEYSQVIAYFFWIWMFFHW